MMNFKLPISETSPRFFETALEPPETQHQRHVSCQRAGLAKTPSSSRLLCVTGTGHCSPCAHRASVPRASPSSAPAGTRSLPVTPTGTFHSGRGWHTLSVFKVPSNPNHSPFPLCSPVVPVPEFPAAPRDPSEVK